MVSGQRDKEDQCWRYIYWRVYKSLNESTSNLPYPYIAGLAAGTTEAVAVVTPMEVVKIRLQAQQHSLADPLETPRYRNAGHAVYTIVREEGFSALYRGVSLTALRQATNQGNPPKTQSRLYSTDTRPIFRRQLYCVPRD